MFLYNKQEGVREDSLFCFLLRSIKFEYNQFENNEITIINFEPEVSFYEFTNNTKGFQFINLAELKRNIRKDYKNRIRKYAFDNIFHLTMNKEEYDLTEKVLKKYVKEYKCIKYDKQ